jgi:hypothetical protein
MDQETKRALRRFFSAQAKLAQLGVIHSRDYIGDIARYLCTMVYGLEPRRSRQPAGYDGTIGTAKTRVQVNNCPTGTKVMLAEPLEFEQLVVVLGPNCALRPEGLEETFILYRFTRQEVIERFKTPGGRYVAGKKTFAQGYDRTLNLDLDELEPTDQIRSK